MAKSKNINIHREAIKWFKKQGWNDISDKIELLHYKYRLENLPYMPHLMIEKDGYKLFINIFNKEDYFRSKKYNCWVTGMDLYKYKFAQAREDLMDIQTAVLFHNEVLKEFIFRQLDQLPNPWQWRVDSCYAHSKWYGRKEEYLNCFKCWKNNPQTCRKCIHRKQKTRPMAVWNIEYFSTNIIFQPKLWLGNKKSA